MKKWWSKVNQTVEGMSYRKKITINLVLCGFVLLLFWSRAGYPLPTEEMEFHRLERTYLLPRSQIIFDSKAAGTIQWRDLPELEIVHNGLVVGTGEGYVHTAIHGRICRWPLEEGITPVPLYNASAVTWKPGIYENGVPLLFLNVPAEAQRAEVTIEAVDWQEKSLRYQGEGWRLEPGRWLFCAYPGDSFSGDWYAGGGYTLRLYREDGTLLAEHNGTLKP